MLVIPVLRKPRQKNCEFEGSLGFREGSEETSLAGTTGAAYLMDGAQRVRVLLLGLLDLPQTAAAFVVLSHLGLWTGMAEVDGALYRRACPVHLWSALQARSPCPPAQPFPDPRTGVGTDSDRMRSS